MIDMTYDPEADAVYIRVARGTIDHQTTDGPFIQDVGADGRILGIEILNASKVLAPGEWQKSQPNARINAAE